MSQRRQPKAGRLPQFSVIDVEISGMLLILSMEGMSLHSNKVMKVKSITM